MGHDSVRAAMIDQHATTTVDRKIATALDEVIGQMDGHRKPARRHPGTGAQRPRMAR
jgi:hypothetical protein